MERARQCSTALLLFDVSLQSLRRQSFLTEVTNFGMLRYWYLIEYLEKV